MFVELGRHGAGVKQCSNKSLAKVLDKEENLNFKPYTFVPTWILKVQY